MKKGRPFTRKQCSRLQREAAQHAKELLRDAREERRGYFRGLSSFRRCDPVRTEALAAAYVGADAPE